MRYREDGSRSFVFNIRHSASGRIALGDAAHEVIARSGHLHVMGTALSSPALVSAVITAAQAIKSRGGTVSFDPNLRPEVLRLPGLREACDALFAICDLFLPSGDELFLFTTARTVDEAVMEVLARGVRAIVHKQGATGATYYDRDITSTQPGFPVDEIDPTGAGDCFGATFVSAWLRGWPPHRSLAYAAASGALAVTRQGPMEGASSQDEIRAFLAARGAAIPS